MADASRLFQAARRTTPEDLAVMGKAAAERFHANDAPSLSDAVAAIVKDAGLSREQVRRVVEHANTDAFLTEFQKEGKDRVVHFSSGPADPRIVLELLNRPTASETSAGPSDYATPPAAAKVASVEVERAFMEAFGPKPAALPFESPLGGAIALRDKLGSEGEHLQAQLSGLEVLYADLANRLYGHMKHAALEGVALGHIADAWTGGTRSPEMIQVAFELFAPRLERENVFPSREAMLASAEKTASQRLVNESHPLVATFSEFSEVLVKLAETRRAHGEVCTALAEITAFLKEAAIAGDLYRAAGRGSKALAGAVSPLVGKALGPSAEYGTQKVLENAHRIGLGLAAGEGYMHLKHSPHPAARAARGAGNLVLRNVPGTRQNLQHKWEIESGQ